MEGPVARSPHPGEPNLRLKVVRLGGGTRRGGPLAGPGAGPDRGDRARQPRRPGADTLLGSTSIRDPGGRSLRLGQGLRWAVAGATVFCVAAAVGFGLAGQLDTRVLRDEFERRLGEALGSEVHVRSVAVSLGLLSVRLSGRDIEAWPGPDGPDLRIERADVELRPFAHLTGQRRLALISLERPHVRLRRDAAGHWTPALPALSLAETAPAAAPRNPDEILSPVIALVATARALLGGALPASRVDLHEAVLEMVGPSAGRARASGIEWRISEASVWRRALLGETLLHLFARLVDRRGDRGGVELQGRLGYGGGVRLAPAGTAPCLAAATAVPGARSGPRATGLLSGLVAFEAPRPGTGRIEVDLIGRNLATPRPDAPSWLGPLTGSRVTLG